MLINILLLSLMLRFLLLWLWLFILDRLLLLRRLYLRYLFYWFLFRRLLCDHNSFLGWLWNWLLHCFLLDYLRRVIQYEFHVFFVLVKSQLMTCGSLCIVKPSRFHFYITLIVQLLSVESFLYILPFNNLMEVLVLLKACVGS